MKKAISIKQLKDEALAFEEKGDKKNAADRLVTIGRQFLKKQDLQKAFLYFERAVSLSPDTAKIYVYLAMADSLRGALVESKQWLNQFCRLTLQKEEFFSLESFILEKLSDFPDLLRHYYEYWISIDRTQSNPFVRIALCFGQMNRPSDAIRWFLEALKTKDKPLFVLKNFKELLENFQKKELLGYLDQLVEEKITLEDFIAIVREEPRHAKQSAVEPVISVPLDKEANFSEMIQAFERDFDLREDPIDKISPLLREFRQKSEPVLAQDDRARMDLALGFYEMELFPVAQEELLKIKEGSDCFFAAQNLLTEILVQQGLLLKALDKLKNLLKISDLPISIRLDSEYKMGWVYYRLGEREKALFWLGKVEAMEPTYRDLTALRIKLKVD